MAGYPQSRSMRTFIYKRTHDDDPDRYGRFGVLNCMGRLRRLPFEAVIGVGGRGHEAEANGLAGKLNWIGIGARTCRIPGLPYPIFTFDHFVRFDRDLCEVAPALARRLYQKHAPRFLFAKLSAREQAEVDRLLAMARRKSEAKVEAFKSRSRARVRQVSTALLEQWRRCSTRPWRRGRIHLPKYPRRRPRPSTGRCDA